MPFDPQFQNKHTPHDLSRLEKSLRRHLSPLITKKNHLNLLNLACGRADETAVLARILSEKSTTAHLQGLDIRAAEIDTARQRWQNLNEKISTSFLTHRGDQLDAIAEFRDHTDLVFLRHQNFWNDSAVWSRIFDQALKQLKTGGHLVITSYFDREHSLAVKALQRLGARKIANIKNPESRQLSDAPGKSVDRHLAIFKKI